MSSKDNVNKPSGGDKATETQGATRRDFMVLAASSVAAVGAACSLWPMVDSLNPAADVLANASIEIDISSIPEGETATFKWRGKPLFIRHRTKEEIASAENANLSALKDPETDDKRIKAGRPEWLVVLGICTHLGCVPLSKPEGWFCPCHGSHYDLSGRITAGPAPLNLEIPPYEFISPTKIKVG